MKSIIIYYYHCTLTKTRCRLANSMVFGLERRWDIRARIQIYREIILIHRSANMIIHITHIHCIRAHFSFVGVKEIVSIDNNITNS